MTKSTRLVKFDNHLFQKKLDCLYNFVIKNGTLVYNSGPWKKLFQYSSTLKLIKYIKLLVNLTYTYIT